MVYKEDRKRMTNIDELYQKFLEKRCSRQELEQLLEFFRKDENSEKIVCLIEQAIESEYFDPVSEEDKRFISEQKIHFRKKLHPAVSQNKYRTKLWIAAIAAFFLVTLSGLLYLFNTRATSTLDDNRKLVQDVAPGGKKATIMLSTGESVELDSLQTVLTMQDGQFYYEGGEALLDASASQFVTLTTPVGGEYQLVLSDGTKVWLNAASSIKYPIYFEEHERRVEIEGEVFFEVVSIKNKPFLVTSQGQEIEVLGTAFNVRNYGDVDITTLVHGSIALHNNETKENIKLIPNEQAIWDGGRLIVNKVDAADYISWTAGIILHQDASLHDICQELERWYGVEFVFSNNLKNTGKAIISINRNEVLSSVLQALEDTYLVSFEIQGKEVFVR